MIYCIIPARSGSKGVPNKNIMEINKIPLLAYSIKIASESKYIEQILISTDSKKYVDISKSYNKNIQEIIRDELTSHDKATDYDYLIHAIFKVQMKMNDIIVLLRPTTPNRKVEIVDDAIKIFNQNNNFDSLRSVHHLSEAPEKMFRINSDKSLKPIIGEDIEITNQPRQNFEDAFQPNGYVDIIKVETIMKSRKAFGNKIYGYITQRVQEIDTLSDIVFLKYQLEKEKCNE